MLEELSTLSPGCYPSIIENLWWTKPYFICPSSIKNSSKNFDLIQSIASWEIGALIVYREIKEEKIGLTKSF